MLAVNITQLIRGTISHHLVDLKMMVVITLEKIIRLKRTSDFSKDMEVGDRSMQKNKK